MTEKPCSVLREFSYPSVGETWLGGTPESRLTAHHQNHLVVYHIHRIHLILQSVHRRSNLQLVSGSFLDRLAWKYPDLPLFATGPSCV